MNRAQVVDAYFMEHRGKLLDLAAFLDRIDRATAESGSVEDFRVSAMRRGIALLQDGQGDRARRILELLSDHSTDPIPAAGTKGACGACPPAADSRGSMP